jgi:putative heme iron utilization protein
MLPYATDAQGRPIFVISSLAVHSKNLNEDARASLLVTAQSADANPLEIGRVTLMGEVRPVPEDEQAAVRERYLERHASSREWMAFGDFQAYRMEVVDVYFIGGFGAMGWVMVGDYAEAIGG